MTTKQELKEQWTKELEALQIRLNALELKHQAYLPEHETERYHQSLASEIHDVMAKMEEKAYEGTYGSEFNYRNSYLPSRFGQLCIDRSLPRWKVMDILSEIVRKKLQIIQERGDYVRLKEEFSIESKKSSDAISTLHDMLDQEIQDVKQNISWTQNRLRKLESDRGWFIQICKDIAQDKKREQDRMQDEIEKKEVEIEVLKMIASGDRQ